MRYDINCFKTFHRYCKCFSYGMMGAIAYYNYHIVCLLETLQKLSQNLIQFPLK